MRCSVVSAPRAASALIESKETPVPDTTTAPPAANPALNGHQEQTDKAKDASTGASTTALSFLPAPLRKGIYAGYGLLALAGTAATAYYGAVPSLTVPDWVTGGLAALGALAAPISVLAASNVGRNEG
jgi:hypothetical protein